MAEDTPTFAGRAAQRARTRALVYGTVAVLLATGAAYTSWRVLSAYEARLAEPVAPGEPVKHVVAARDLRAGAVLALDDLMVVEQPVNIGVDSLFDDPAMLIGQTLGDRTLAGEPLRIERLTSGGARLWVNQVIDPGSRAVTLRVARAEGVGGLLRPGFFVDVIVTIRPDTRDLTAAWVTETILQGARVVAINDDVASSSAGADYVSEPRQPGEPTPRELYVTLEVEPAKAEGLALATARGQVHLTLRAQDDYEMLEPSGPLVANALVGLPVPVAQAQARRLERKKDVSTLVQQAVETTELIRGRSVTVEEYDAEGRLIRTRVGR